MWGQTDIVFSTCFCFSTRKEQCHSLTSRCLLSTTIRSRKLCVRTQHTDYTHMFHVTTVKPVVPKCSVPKSVPVGKSAELRCVEEEGFPKSQYQWFRNREEIPDDPKTSPKFFNSSYTLNSETGTLVSMCVCVRVSACVWTRTCFNGKGGAVGMVAWCPGVGADILGRQLMVREGFSHEGNLLSSFAHSSILSCFPAQPDLLIGSLRATQLSAVTPASNMLARQSHTTTQDSICFYMILFAFATSSVTTDSLLHNV